MLILPTLKTVRTMDIEQKRRLRERILLTLVGIMAVIANLPAHLLDSVGVQRELALAIFGIVVFLALFLYVRLFFFLLYLLLAIGANLPEQWAQALHISTLPLLIALISMVSLSLLNYSVKVLPSGLKPLRKKPNPEGIKALLSAIERRSLPQVRSILSMDFDINMAGENGETPLLQAVRGGEIAIVDLLLAAGADPTDRDITAATGQTEIHQRLTNAITQRAAKASAGSGDANNDSTL